jgi:hypothetical protein
VSGSEERDAAPVSDEELTALALAADPNAPLAADAVAWRGSQDSPSWLLPEWYMAPPMASGRRRGTLAVIAVVFAGILVIDAFGLCITSGFLSWA